MTREIFCNQIKELKSTCGLKGLEICTRSQFMPSQIARLINGVHNFAMNKAFVLLSALNGGLLITKGDNSRFISSYPELVGFLIDARADANISKYKLEKTIGASISIVDKYERQLISVSVDTFLKIMDAMGYTVEVRRIE